MGCAIFLDERIQNHEPQRQNNKTKKIDCRKKSTQGLDSIRENINIISNILNQK